MILKEDFLIDGSQLNTQSLLLRRVHISGLRDLNDFSLDINYPVLAMFEYLIYRLTK
jgi:hypothetical protein